MPNTPFTTPRVTNALRLLNEAMAQANKDFPVTDERDLFPQTMGFGVNFLAFLIGTSTQDPTKYQPLTEFTIRRLRRAVEEVVFEVNKMSQEDALEKTISTLGLPDERTQASEEQGDSHE